MLYSVWQSCAHGKLKALRGQQNRGVAVVWAAESVHHRSQRSLGLSLDFVKWMRGAPEKAQASRPHLVENDIFRL